MAGHIDHGKTTLTKRLTGVETDQLKEEKERKISIEPGFAPLVQSEQIQISIIDVPGHERFIRQMIAGVAGIDVVVLVVAADEGVMPQTEEHLQILSLLDIDTGVIAITKTDQVDEDFLEIVTEDIADTVRGTFLENAPIYLVDNYSGKGIDILKKDLISIVENTKKRSTFHSFRLPVDHVFTVKGQGVIVRGTVFDGTVHVGDELTLLPSHKKVRVRQIQSHHEQKEAAFAGQRAAINIGGVSHESIKRGHVLVKDDFYRATSRIDIALTPLETFRHPIKQRQFIKLNVGTSEVTGKMIFYDRNELRSGNSKEILCQLELDEAIVVTRGDRFIIRRASPVETLGGGWVINAVGEKRRFGTQSMEQLQGIKDGSPKERVFTLLSQAYALTKADVLRLAAVTEKEFEQMTEQLININKQMYTKQSVKSKVIEKINRSLHQFHQTYPLRRGINKAELISSLSTTYPTALLEYALSSSKGEETIQVMEDIVSKKTFIPSLPSNWKARIERMITAWVADGANVKKMEEYFIEHGIDESLHTDLYYYLIHTKEAYHFDEDRLIARSVVKQLREDLYEQTRGESFTLQIARDIVGLSRKNLVPLLELFDELQYTERIDNERMWLD